METAHSEWPTVRLGSILRSKAFRGKPDLPLLSVVRERGVIVRDVEDLTSNHNVIPDDLSNYKIVAAGDLVINKMKAWQGSAGVAPSAGIVSPAYFVFETSLKDKRYAHYLFRSRFFVDNYARCSDGVRIGQWDLNMTAIKNLRIPTPPVHEQNIIGKFLDHAEIRIAKAIQAKQKMVELLNEQKQVIISELVTRGLNPDVPMKDSGQAWLGQIPAHWDVVHLRSLITLRSGRNSGDEALLSVLRSKGVIPRDHDRKANHNVIPDDLSNYKQVRIGDLVVNKMKAWSGSVGISEYDGIVSPAYFVYRLRFGNSKYWNLLLRGPGIKHEFARASKGVRVGQWDLDPFGLKSISIPVPPDSEQAAIAEAVSQQIGQIETAISAIEHEIELLKEYRIVLISDVVTGKKDVRAEAADLPDIDPAELALVLSGAVSVDAEEDEDYGTSEVE